MNDWVFVVTNDEGGIIGVYTTKEKAQAILDALPYPGTIEPISLDEEYDL